MRVKEITISRISPDFDQDAGVRPAARRRHRFRFALADRRRSGHRQIDADAAARTKSCGARLTVLYVCGEESVEQTSLRASRLNVGDDHLYLLSETLFSSIKAQIDHLKPDAMIVDSIQIVYKSELPSAPGSVSQVRELAMEFMHIAKGIGFATFLIGHVTKSARSQGLACWSTSSTQYWTLKGIDSMVIDCSAR